MNIYAGNLSQDVTEDDLRKAFRAFGEVSFVNIIRDRLNKSKAAFGILEMPVLVEAEAAIAGLNATELKGLTLTVNETRPRTQTLA